LCHRRRPGSTEEPGGFTPRLWTSTRAGPMAPTMAAPHQQNGHQGTATGRSPDRPDLVAGPCPATVPPVEAGASRGRGEDLPPAARSASSDASPHPPSPNSVRAQGCAVVEQSSINGAASTASTHAGGRGLSPATCRICGIGRRIRGQRVRFWSIPPAATVLAAEKLLAAANPGPRRDEPGACSRRCSRQIRP